MTPTEAIEVFAKFTSPDELVTSRELNAAIDLAIQALRGCEAAEKLADQAILQEDNFRIEKLPSGKWEVCTDADCRTLYYEPTLIAVLIALGEVQG